MIRVRDPYRMAHMLRLQIDYNIVHLPVCVLKWYNFSSNLFIILMQVKERHGHGRRRVSGMHLFDSGPERQMEEHFFASA